MIVGSFGDLIFLVSSSQICTFESMTWQNNARWSEHERHLNDPLPEFLGNQNDKMTFAMVLSIFAGTNPMTELVKILNMERSGSPHYLVVGDKAYGKGRWVIQSSKIELQRFDGAGDLLSAKVSVTLLAYPTK
jgi:hypothetical protein